MKIMFFSAIMALQSNSVGSDNLLLKFLKICSPALIPIITCLFNQIIQNKSYPQLWKYSKVICIPKTNDTSPSDLRPITLLSVLSKAFESIIDTQMKIFINNENLISSRQSSFRSCYNTALLY